LPHSICNHDLLVPVDHNEDFSKAVNVDNSTLFLYFVNAPGAISSRDVDAPL